MSQASEAIKQQRDYSDQKLRDQAMRGQTFGKEDMARYDALAGRSPAGKKEASSPSPEPKPAPATSPATQAGNTSINTGARSEAKERAQNAQASSSYKKFGSGGQNVTQDNDQVSNVTGNDNYVNQTQDNSVRNYEGDNRVFNYQGGSGNDSPVSMATMAGFFAPDDSHAANAARLDRQVTQNRDNQKQYANSSYIAEGAIARANKNAYIDPAALDKRIADRERYSHAKSTVMGNNIFGDMFSSNAPKWNSAKPQEEIETPDFNEMYEKYSDF